MAEFGVGGVPHFVFMDSNNQALAAAVGRIPSNILEGMTSILMRALSSLPFQSFITPAHQ